MADRTADDDLDLKPAEAGTMFRLEMFATNFFLGYWRQMLAFLVTGLLGVLLWGQWTSYDQRLQRATAAEIADAVQGLPAEIPGLPMLIASDPSTDLGKIEAAGDQVLKIAEGARGAARVEGFLTAAELFRVTGKTDKQRAALTEASERGSGMLRYAAESGLANLELGNNEGDAAVARLKKLAAAQKGYLAEQATLDLALALEHLGRKDEALGVYADFEKKFKDSKRVELVEERRARLEAPPVAPAPAEVPADPNAPTEPPDPAAPAGGGE